MRNYLLVFFGLLAALTVVGCGANSEVPKAKMCAANMRLMMGSLEMYNMDNKDMIKTPTIEMYGENGKIVQQKYLKSAITMPHEKCSYVFKGDFSDPGNCEISWAYHGTVEDIGKNFK